MAKSGDVQNTASPPFATPDGKPAGGSSSGSGGRDFLKDPTGPTNGFKPRDFVATGSRPQAEATAFPKPPPEEVPKGGQTTLAEPGSVVRNMFGGPPTTAGDGGPKPFKNLK